MNASQRRQAILTALQQEKDPVSAAVLAGRFGVSRQIVVGDVALLRAEGASILSTPRGYLLERSEGILRAVTCRHSAGEMEAELNLMVDHGCTVVDTVVEHPIYGKLSGQLALQSRYDVGEFLRKVAGHEAKPLSALTEGVHLHTLRCPNEETFARVCAALDEAGFLLHDRA